MSDETEDAAAVADGVVRGWDGVLQEERGVLLRDAGGAKAAPRDEAAALESDSQGQVETLEGRRKRALAALANPGMSSVAESLGKLVGELTEEWRATRTPHAAPDPDHRQMGNWFLQYLHDSFPMGFGGRGKSGNWEDPYVAWQRCFEHVSVGEVEMYEDNWVVVLVTPRPKDLASGLVKYSVKVQQAMVKAFGREVQLVPRLEAA